MNFGEDRDQYGGSIHRRFSASGFYRLEKDDRWWFVSPEGNAFLSLGINHLDTDRFVPREKFARRFGLDEDFTEEDFFQGLREKVARDWEAFGLNTLGCHTSSDWHNGAGFPYVYQLLFVEICPWLSPSKKDFVDVFTDDFVRHCDQFAKEHVLPRRNDPYLLGYSLCDCPVLTEMDAERWTGGWIGTFLPTWPRVLRNLGSDSPGKTAYVNCMKRVYAKHISAFNETYGTVFPSFEILRLASENRGPCFIVINTEATFTDDSAHPAFIDWKRTTGGGLYPLKGMRFSHLG